MQKVFNPDNGRNEHALEELVGALRAIYATFIGRGRF